MSGEEFYVKQRRVQNMNYQSDRLGTLRKIDKKPFKSYA